MAEQKTAAELAEMWQNLYFAERDETRRLKQTMEAMGRELVERQRIILAVRDALHAI